MNKSILENAFNDGFKYELNSRPIKSVLPILEKNIIILILYNPKNKKEFEIRLYNINNIRSNNYLYKKYFSVPMEIKEDIYPNIKLYKIDYQKILLKYKYGYQKVYFTFFDIEYNENEKPINIKLINAGDISRLYNEIYDLNSFDENNIISTVYRNDFIYIFKKSEENEFFLGGKKLIQKSDGGTLKKIKEMGCGTGRNEI